MPREQRKSESIVLFTMFDANGAFCLAEMSRVNNWNCYWLGLWNTRQRLSLCEVRFVIFKLFNHRTLSGLESYDPTGELATNNAPDPYPTVHHSIQKWTHFYSKLCIVGYGRGAFWDLWIWSVELWRLSWFPGLHSSVYLGKHKCWLTAVQ